MQDLVSFCSWDFKEVYFWPWLCHYLSVVPSLTCGKVSFVNVYFLLETCGLGGWGFGIACYVVLSVLELLPAPQNCLAPKGQEIITFKGFSWWLYSFPCVGGLFDFSQNLVSRYSEKIFLLVLKLE